MDYDADGDLDVLSGSYTGEIYYFERLDSGELLAFRIHGVNERFVEEMRGFAAAGIEGVMVMPTGPDPLAITESLATSAIPQLSEI